MKLGVDTGGTFTDFILQDEHKLQRYKVSSTPDDPSRAIVKGMHFFFGDDIPADLEIVHGTTVGTNAFLERKGARVLLVTTHGFEDVLTIGRQNRFSLYDLDYQRPQAIIPDHFITGVKERICFDGSVQLPLLSEGKRLSQLVQRYDIEAVVICLLHSYANPSHEQELARQLAHLGLPLILSSDVLPEFREYERLCTTLINGYLAPIMARYIKRLKDHLQGQALSIQQSNGGILPASQISRRTVHTVLSGPAGGVQGAFHLAQQMGRQQIITFDMGGTSTDVSLCDGEPSITREYTLDGFPVRIPLLDIHTVGAGGGSIAQVDEGGLLHVGPHSAGADPGPVCYGIGERLAVTDANLLLGRLQAGSFLSGRMHLDMPRTREIMTTLATSLGLTVEEAALGIIRIVNAGMVKAIRAVSLERGYDPKDFSLFSFGGASGLHCCELARELGIMEIIIPARAGILSAQGMVFAAPLLDRSQSLFLQGEQLQPATITTVINQLKEQLSQEMASLKLDGEIEFSAFVDLRYQGQSHEIEVGFSADFCKDFHDAHKFAFGYCLPEKELECVAVRCCVQLQRPLSPLPFSPIPTSPLQVGDTVEVVWEDGIQEIPLYYRPDLHDGYQGIGPCLIVDDYTTILVTSYFAFQVDNLSNILLQSIASV